MTVALRMFGVDVFIGNVQVLKGVNMKVPESTTCGLVGRNGAGKTTLLRTIIGLQGTTRGEVCLFGADLTSAPPRRRAQMGIGFMPEDRRLVPELSVRENLALPLDVNSLADARQRIDAVVDLIPELAPLMERNGNQLSGGQQKIVAFARSIAYGSRMLILDEPFEGIAPALTMRLRSVVEKMRSTGRAVIVSASERHHVVGLCDVVYEIERGEVVPAEIPPVVQNLADNVKA